MTKGALSGIRKIPPEFMLCVTSNLSTLLTPTLSNKVYTAVSLLPAWMTGFLESMISTSLKAALGAALARIS